MIENLPSEEIHDALEWMENDDVDWTTSRLQPRYEDEAVANREIPVLAIEKFIQSPWEPI